MKYKTKDLKAMARAQLSGKYGVYIGAYLLTAVIQFVISMVLNTVNSTSLLSLIYNGSLFSSGNTVRMITYLLIEFIVSLILSVLTLGFNKMFLDGSRGYEVHFEDLFYGFRHHPDRVILMQLLMGLINLGCILPGYVIAMCALYFSSFILIPFGILLMIAGMILMIYFSLAFSQSMFLMADYDDLGPVQALKESQKMMSGNKLSYLYMELSFLGLLLLSVFSCYIGLLWVMPYMSMTMTNFYRNISGEI